VKVRFFRITFAKTASLEAQVTDARIFERLKFVETEGGAALQTCLRLEFCFAERWNSDSISVRRSSQIRLSSLDERAQVTWSRKK